MVLLCFADMRSSSAAAERPLTLHIPFSLLPHCGTLHLLPYTSASSAVLMLVRYFQKSYLLAEPQILLLLQVTRPHQAHLPLLLTAPLLQPPLPPLQTMQHPPALLPLLLLGSLRGLMMQLPMQLLLRKLMMRLQAA